MSDELVRHVAYLRDLAEGRTETILPATVRKMADRIEALTEAIGWALRVPSTGDGAAAEAMRVILRRALEPQK